MSKKKLKQAAKRVYSGFSMSSIAETEILLETTIFGSLQRVLVLHVLLNCMILNFRIPFTEFIAKHPDIRWCTLAPQADEYLTDNYFEWWCLTSHSGTNRAEIIFEARDNVFNVFFSILQFVPVEQSTERGFIGKMN